MSNAIVPASGGAVVPAAASTDVVPAGPLSGTTVFAQRKAAAAAMPPIVEGKNPTNTAVAQSEQEIVAEFQSGLTADGVPSQYIEKAVAWYSKWAAREAQIEQQLDAGDRIGCLEALRRRWGTSYAANMRAARAAFGRLPPFLQTALETGTLSDGRMVLHAEAAWLWLIDSKTQSPAPPSGDTPSISEAQELANLRKMMADKTSPYWKGREAARNQSRYRELVAKAGK